MVLSTQKERVYTLLRDTITLLCKNGLSFDTEFSIEALIGITLDKQDVFLVNINEIIRSEAGEKQAERDRERENKRKSHDEGFRNSDSDDSSGGEHSNRKRRKRKQKSIVKTENDSSSDSDSNCEDNNYSIHNEQSTPAGQERLGMSIKRDEEEEDLDDIIVIKEEVGDDWSQFCEPNTAPSTSHTRTHSFTSPSSSFVQSMSGPSSHGWSSAPVGGAAGLSGNDASSPAGLPGDLSQQVYPMYKCGTCGKLLKSRGSLSVHMRLHEGKYNYSCSICNKGFSSTYMLKGHMSWHTGIKEYKCTLCPKEFRYSHELKQHVMRKHIS